MTVKFTLKSAGIYMPSAVGTIVSPQVPDSAHSERGYTCPHCFQDIGLTIKSGIRDGLVVKCPWCTFYSIFERHET